jgi:hypothetical protein
MYEKEEWFKDLDDGKPSKDIFVHIKKRRGEGEWVQVKRRFLRVPSVGEIFQIGDNSPAFKVALVVHCPFKATYGAELWCFETDWIGEIKALDG